MSNKMLDRILNIVTLDFGQKKIVNDVKKISLANILYVLGRPIKNRVIIHSEVFKEICNDSIDNKYTTKVEEELYYLAETDPNQLGGKYEALKGNSKLLHSKGNSLRMFVTRDNLALKILAICKAEIWHKDENKISQQASQRMATWKETD